MNNILTSLIIIGSILLLLYLVHYIIYKNEEDLSKLIPKPDQPIKLKFIKDEYNQYSINFFNPIFNEYWLMPDIKAAIYKEWSILEKGSFGAYDLCHICCDHNEIDYYKNKFKTFQDLYNHFNTLNKEYYKWKEHKTKMNNLPSEIY